MLTLLAISSARSRKMPLTRAGTGRLQAMQERLRYVRGELFCSSEPFLWLMTLSRPETPFGRQMRCYAQLDSKARLSTSHSQGPFLAMVRCYVSRRSVTKGTSFMQREITLTSTGAIIPSTDSCSISTKLSSKTPCVILRMKGSFGEIRVVNPRQDPTASTRESMTSSVCICPRLF